MSSQAQELRRRLDVLNQRAAQYGINTPPEVTTQIEDLSNALQTLKIIEIHRANARVYVTQLANFSGSEPVHIRTQLAKERAQIRAQIQRAREYKVTVAPDPVDTEIEVQTTEIVQEDVFMRTLRDRVTAIEMEMRNDNIDKAFELVLALKRFIR